MAKRNSGDFYTVMEKHLVRILLLILLIFAGYKLLRIEAPHSDPPSVQSKLTSVPKVKKRPCRVRKKRVSQHGIGTLPEEGMR
jgi:hypothetical protein